MMKVKICWISLIFRCNSEHFKCIFLCKNLILKLVQCYKFWFFTTCCSFRVLFSMYTWVSYILWDINNPWHVKLFILCCNRGYVFGRHPVYIIIVIIVAKFSRLWRCFNMSSRLPVCLLIIPSQRSTMPPFCCNPTLSPIWALELLGIQEKRDMAVPGTQRGCGI